MGKIQIDSINSFFSSNKNIEIVKKLRHSWKWPMIQLFGMTLLAYIVAFLTYQILD